MPERGVRVDHHHHDAAGPRDWERGTSREHLIGDSEPMQQLLSLVDRIGRSSASVLITGESGTGKELVARALHRRGGRTGAFVALNCAAMPEALLESELFGHVRGAFTGATSDRVGLFRLATGGTLFFDEIGAMPPGLQAKLLRALQERKVRPVGGDREAPFDACIVSATNRDLDAAVDRGEFRDDLFFRLNVIHVPVPPLRARKRDIVLLARYFLARCAERDDRSALDLSSAAADRLLDCPWPGNVRELENCIEHAVTMAQGDEILVEDLPARIRDHGAPPTCGDEVPAELMTMEELERRYIRRVLEIVCGNKSEAARVLGLDRKTLYRRIERYGIDVAPRADLI